MNTKKIRIKFLANAPHSDDLTPGGSRQLLVINPAYWMMKTYHDIHGKSKPQWLIQDFIPDKNVTQTINDLLRNKVNILILPCFVWNIDLQMEIAKAFKERVPTGKVLAGGPQLQAHKDPKFFKKHPYVDFVGYGDGEKSVSNIIDYIATGERGPWVNTVENVGGYAKLWPFEVLRDEKYWSTSPYLTQKDFIREHIKSLKDKGYMNKDIMLAVEFARGCMYSCAYCDWSSNLTNKVTRRKAPYQLELDFFKELDISIRETDANFGQWKQDIEIFDYATSIYDPEKNFKFLVWNTAKLKQNADHFLIGNHETHGKQIVFTFEDTEKVCLEAMQRPSLPWEKQQEMIAKIKHRLGDERFHRATVAELMVGTPKQSIETFKENFRKILGEGIGGTILNHWALLPNSPAADPEYIKKHGIEFIEHKTFSGKDDERPTTPFSIEQLYSDAKQNPHFLSANFVYKTNDMDYTDIMTVLMVGFVLQEPLIKEKILSKSKTNIDRVIEWAFKRCAKNAKEVYSQHKDCIEKFGYIIPITDDPEGIQTSWTTGSLLKFPETVDA